MHETSLARSLLQAVLTMAAEHDAKRVRVVRGWIAETEHLDPTSIGFHFQAHATGTAAEGAELQLELRHVEARCSCGVVYKPEHHLTLCPKCGSTEGEILGETGLAVEAIEVD